MAIMTIPVSEIKAGDRFIDDRFIGDVPDDFTPRTIWTAVEDAEILPHGIELWIRFPDGGRVVRHWDSPITLTVQR